jgi:hypothetical protein
LAQRYGVRLPDDFRDYLVHSGPANDFGFDQNFTTWWSPARIRNIVEEYEHPIRNEVIATDAAKYLFFADHAIWCWAWQSRAAKTKIGSSSSQAMTDSWQTALRSSCIVTSMISCKSHR